MSPGSSSLSIPRNIELPFFAYGIFQPGQLGFFQVNDFVDRVQPANTDGLLIEKDGIPLLISNNQGMVCSGFLLFPKEDKAEEFYETISKMEPEQFYRWEMRKVYHPKSDVEFVNANILSANSNRQMIGGTHPLEKPFWDGREDPLLVLGLDEVKKLLFIVTKQKM